MSFAAGHWELVKPRRKCEATFCKDKEQMDKTVTCWAPARRTRHQKTAGSWGRLRDNRKRIEDGKRNAETKTNDKKAENQVVPSHRSGYPLISSRIRYRERGVGILCSHGEEHAAQAARPRG